MPGNNFSSFAIFAAMRSGSNLLERNINQFSGLKCHGELFNPAFIGWSGQKSYCGIDKSERDAAPERLITAITQDDRDNVPGFRIFREHNRNAIDRFLNDETCAKIILTRSPIDSFVSLKIARKTDQWLIHDQAHRKSAQIYVDMREFREYQKTRQHYSDGIAAQLSESGQKFFEVEFDQLLDINKMNELAAFLGVSTPLMVLDQPIKRQNPEPLWEKIVNYDEVRAELGLEESPLAPKPVQQFETQIGTDLSRAYFAENQNIIFAPMPSSPDGSVRKWLADHLNAELKNGFGDDALEKWRDNHAGPLVFSVLRHPIERAYDVFMRKIFKQNSGAFVTIRKTLVDKFGVFLPDDSQDLAGQNYDLTAHKAAFKQFLAFIHHNLTEKTEIRTDGRWRPQADLLDAYVKSLGPTQVFKEPDLHHLAAYMANRFDAPRPTVGILPDVAQWPIGLSEIYDSEIESLTRIAYATDYNRFNFNDGR